MAAAHQAGQPPWQTHRLGATPRLGLRANWQQFTILVVVNAFVGGMVGLERSVLPLLAEQQFALASRTAILSFLVSFGLCKAGANYLAGRLSDRLGRKPVLLIGWLIGLPAPLLVIWAPTWAWVVGANVLLGVNQGLTWSTTVNMKIDLVGPARRGLATGLNEAAGYVAVSLAALAAGYLAAAYGPRPAPFALGVGFALLGLLLTATVRETHHHTRLEAGQHAATGVAAVPVGSPREGEPRSVFLHTSFTNASLSSVSQAGLVNNLNDGVAWGLFPLFFAAGGLNVAEVALLAAVYPGVWGLGQLVTGWASDRLGRKWLIVAGMWVQAGGILLVAGTGTFGPWLAGAVLLGAGTALVYPTLLAAIGDVAHPSWRASAVGVYRLWRDAGYAAGALLSGIIADRLGIPAAIAAVGVLTALSGAVVAVRMRETAPDSSATHAGSAG
ncbi:MAG: MFS transporter [Chloroflexota bacterium]